jgi:hypothetical protein
MGIDAPERTAMLRRAVELMTAWKDSGADPSLIFELVSSDLDHALVDDRLLEEAGLLISGLTALNAVVLRERELDLGESITSILRDIGRQLGANLLSREVGASVPPTGVDLACRRNEGQAMATRPMDSPVCPGSGTYPDVVSDPILDELAYVCAACRASVPSFEPAPTHRRALASF